MQCSTCSRGANSKLSFHCVACARNSLYEIRIQLAVALLEREDQGRRVDSIVLRERGEDSPRDKDTQKIADRWGVQEASARTGECAERAQEALNHSDILRKEIERGKAEIAQRRATIVQRRSEYLSASHDLSTRQATALEAAEKSVRRVRSRGDQQHLKISESRVFLSREAAKLYGLRQRKRRKDGAIKDDYLIGGISIVDLRDLNAASPGQITTSIGHIAHILTLVSHYLSLQLPAQIILPHRDYPLPTIFSPSSSYFPREVPFPGSTPIHSSNTSPSASKNNDFRPLPRPRPLYLDKPLPVLAKEDQLAYSLFVEGITLLAWDIAWVCRSQGVNVASSSWEDVCAMGRNLWQLLVATPYQLALPKASTSRQTRTKTATAKADGSPSTDAAEARPYPNLGHYSHGSAHSFLGAAEGAEYMRSWKLQGPMKIVDKLKSALLGEMTGAEWEMLEQKEWDDADQRSDEPVLVGGNRDDAACNDAERPQRANTPGFQDEGEEDRGNTTDGSKARTGSGGWMKLKPRQAPNNV